MLELGQGVDILAEVGEIDTMNQAQALFELRCDRESLDRKSTRLNSSHYS